MKQNELDNFFKKQIVEQKQLPKGIHFRKEKIFDKIEQKIEKPKNNRYAFAGMLILFLLSSFWNVKQFQQISQQKKVLANQANLLKENDEKIDMLASNQISLQDSLIQMKKDLKINKVKIHLSDFSQFQNTMPVCLKQIPLTNELMKSSIKRIKIKNQSVPEPDLPTFYESDYLLASSISNEKESNSRRGLFRKKNNYLKN
jgi:hypothetical protein